MRKLNRILKFRAWDEQNKIMHYNFQFVSSGNNGNDWILFKSDKEDNIIKIQNPYFREQLKIMQYIGLKDKNGKEIFEYDIIKCGEFIYHIYYNEKMFCFYIEDIKNEFKCPLFHLNDYLNKKIIGNIYENPELLKEG